MRDFGHVIETNQALLGVFVCFHRTKDMQVEAEKLGFASAPSGRKVPRMQIVTIKELLEEKKRPDIPEGWTPRRPSGVGKPTGRQLDAGGGVVLGWIAEQRAAASVAG